MPLPIAFHNYAQWVHDRWLGRESEKDLSICALGLAGETGEVIEHFKKYIRDGRSLAGNAALALELGDVLHYWLRLCHYADIKPEEVMAMNIDKLNARDRKTQL